MSHYYFNTNAKRSIKFDVPFYNYFVSKSPTFIQINSISRANSDNMGRSLDHHNSCYSYSKVESLIYVSLFILTSNCFNHDMIYYQGEVILLHLNSKMVTMDEKM